MTTHDKAAIGYSIGIAAVAVAIASYGASGAATTFQDIPVAPPMAPADAPADVAPDIPEEPSQAMVDPFADEEQRVRDMLSAEDPMDAEAPAAPEAPEAPEAPAAPEAPEAPEAPAAPEETTDDGADAEAPEETTDDGADAEAPEATTDDADDTAGESTEEETADVPAGPMTWDVVTPEGTSVPGCEQEDTCFMPSQLEISVGDTVAWHNNDVVAHTVSSGSPQTGPTGAFDSGLMMADTVYEFTFEESGTYDFFCLVHPWMLGTVQVN